MKKLGASGFCFCHKDSKTQKSFELEFDFPLAELCVFESLWQKQPRKVAHPYSLRTSPCQDHFGMLKLRGTSSGDRWYWAIVVVVAHAK